MLIFPKKFKALGVWFRFHGILNIIIAIVLQINQWKFAPVKVILP